MRAYSTRDISLGLRRYIVGVFLFLGVKSMNNPFKSLNKHDYMLWFVSLVVVAISNIMTGVADYMTLLATLTGVTALIFLAKGDVFGQILTVVFSIMYAITAYKFRYYGEMITYVGMTLPIALMSVVSWIRHPYEKGKNEVKIHTLTSLEKIIMIFLTLAVTILFYFILKWLNTPNLEVSTLSIATSFLASYLMFYRNPFYAVAYALNDIVLIILWILASLSDFSYFPMIICFLMFLINDLYAFVHWKIREKKQRA